VHKADNLTFFMCELSRNSGSLNLQESFGPVQASTGTALPLFIYLLCIYYLIYASISQAESPLHFLRLKCSIQLSFRPHSPSSTNHAHGLTLPLLSRLLLSYQQVKDLEGCSHGLFQICWNKIKGNKLRSVWPVVSRRFEHSVTHTEVKLAASFLRDPYFWRI
jgi:hypothetical protein